MSQTLRVAQRFGIPFTLLISVVLVLLPGMHARGGAEDMSSWNQFKPRHTGSDLVVHEWGVFTVSADQRFANYDRVNEWDTAPEYMFRIYPEIKADSKKPTETLKSIARKPVIYFYSKDSGAVSTYIRFNQGTPVIWWPADNETPARIKHGYLRPYLNWQLFLGDYVPASSFPDYGEANKDGDWEIVKVTREDYKPLFVKTKGWAKDLRLKDPATITVMQQETESVDELDIKKVQHADVINYDPIKAPVSEKYLYYDGLVELPKHIEKIKVTNNDITIRNNSNYQLQGVYVIDRRGVKMKTARLDQFTPYKTQKLKLTEHDKDENAQTQILHQLKKDLLKAGLYEAEVDSMLKIWRDGLLGAPGLTVFHLMRREVYDQAIRLYVTPKPKAVVRVGLVVYQTFEGREAIDEELTKYAVQLADDRIEVREQAELILYNYGPAYIPTLKKLLDASDSLEARARLEHIIRRLDVTKWYAGELKKEQDMYNKDH